MANMIPLIKSGGFFASRYWTPLVIGNGLTTTGGDTPDPPVQKTVSGSIVTITDALAAPAVALSTAINPVQDLHGYSNPWPAGGGKNKLLPNYSSGASHVTKDVTYTNTDGVVNVNGTPTGDAYYILFPNTDGQRLSLPAGTYTISCQETTANCRVNFTAVGVASSVLNANQHSYTFTLSSDGEMYANILTNGSSLVNLTLHIQLELGSSATSFAPYSNVCPISGFSAANIVVSPTQDAQDGTTYTVQFGAAGTVYGGTLDAVNGTLTVDREMFALKDQTFDGTTSYQSSLTSANGLVAVRWHKNNMPDRIDKTQSAISSYAKSNIFRNFNAQVWNNANSLDAYGYTDGLCINVRYDQIGLESWTNNNNTVKNAWNTSSLRNDGYVILKLATEQTYTLTPTEVTLLLGTNNVWGDTNGDVTLTYLADGNVSASSALNMLLGGTYTPSADVTDREALNIIMGDTT